MQHQFIIDRFEGEYAVCERQDGGMVNIPRALLPHSARPGDVLMHEDGTWRVDTAATAARREKIRALQKGLWE